MSATRPTSPIPRLNASKKEIRIYFMRRDISLPAWSRANGLNYPTVHRVMSGGIKAARRDGMGQRIVEMLNAELEKGRRGRRPSQGKEGKTG